ncbi:protein kinase family protein [Oleomonas cavernae]|uniref:hypothetical protein n=1 Tax=Oleomonas cavernae TaxID=2320859 RepID=UPI003082E41A
MQRLPGMAGAGVPANKNLPSAEWIAGLRRRYQVERHIDLLLTRKLQRRAGPGFEPVPLARLVQALQALLRVRIEGAFTIEDARWLSGGASKLQVAFALDWDRPGVGRERTPMVLRMEPAESIVETSRLREFQLIKAMEGVVPVPPVFWCDAEGEYFPYPALVYGFAPGVTKPSEDTNRVSGVGAVVGGELRRKLAPQFVDHLARIHNHDFAQGDLSAFDVPAGGGTQCAAWG